MRIGKDEAATATVRAIRPEDQAAVAKIIRSSLIEFGMMVPGSAIHDPDVDSMFDFYRGSDRGYLVVELNGHVVGGAGFAPLEGGEPGVCELRKMYFIPETRGLGLGKQVLLQVIEAATQAGYHTIYLETICAMTSAQGLYERCGFQRLDASMGATGHTPCDVWYARPLTTTPP